MKKCREQDRTAGLPMDTDKDGNIDRTSDLAIVSTLDGIVIVDVSGETPVKMDMIPIQAGKVVVDRDRRLAYDGGINMISLKHIEEVTDQSQFGMLRDTDKDGIDDRLLCSVPEASGMSDLSEDGSILRTGWQVR
jgi:hypothetical protein